MKTTSATVIAQLEHPQVRDLAWACFSDGLLNLDNALPTPSLSPARADWLATLDKNPAPLLSHLDGRQQGRLGLYYEALWQFFITEDPAFDLIAHNLPVRDGGRTLGEFDLLYFCREQQRPVHLELALKFYLGYAPAGSETGFDQWLGPNSRDRLDLKLARLQEHQAQLGLGAAGSAALRAVGIDQVLPRIHLAGRLYRPVSRRMPPPPAYREDQPLQRWCHASLLNTALAEQPEFRWQWLKREQWLAPVEPCAGEPMPADELPPQASKRPTQLAASDTRGKERLRLFVVPDDWPAIATTS